MTTEHRCKQCGRVMGLGDWILGPVCDACCRRNQAEAAGRRYTPRRKTHRKTPRK